MNNRIDLEWICKKLSPALNVTKVLSIHNTLGENNEHKSMENATLTNLSLFIFQNALRIH